MTEADSCIRAAAICPAGMWLLAALLFICLFLMVSNSGIVVVGCMCACHSQHFMSFSWTDAPLHEITHSGHFCIHWEGVATVFFSFFMRRSQ